MARSAGQSRVRHRGVVLLVLLAATAFSAIISAAVAGHWHNYACGGSCSIYHGFVHGSSTTDGSYFARINDHAPDRYAYWSDCWVYGNYTIVSFDEGATGAGCNAWTGSVGFYNEQSGALARVHSYDTPGSAIPEHNHYPH